MGAKSKRHEKTLRTDLKQTRRPVRVIGFKHG